MGGFALWLDKAWGCPVGAFSFPFSDRLEVESQMLEDINTRPLRRFRDTVRKSFHLDEHARPGDVDLQAARLRWWESVDLNGA